MTICNITLYLLFSGHGAIHVFLIHGRNVWERLACPDSQIISEGIQHLRISNLINVSRTSE